MSKSIVQKYRTNPLSLGADFAYDALFDLGALMELLVGLPWIIIFAVCLLHYCRQPSGHGDVVAGIVKALAVSVLLLIGGWALFLTVAFTLGRATDASSETAMSAGALVVALIYIWMTLKAFQPNWFQSKKLEPEQREFWSRIQRPTTDDEYAVIGRPIVASGERTREIVSPANLVRTFGGALGLAIIFGSIFGGGWIIRTYGENTPGSTIDFLILMGVLAIGTVAGFWILIRSERRAKAIEREEF